MGSVIPIKSGHKKMKKEIKICSEGVPLGKPQRTQRNTLRTLKEYPFKDITEKIISCAIEVHSSLGPGLLENLYEEAMEHELKSRGIEYKR